MNNAFYQTAKARLRSMQGEDFSRAGKIKPEILQLYMRNGHDDSGRTQTHRPLPIEEKDGAQAVTKLVLLLCAIMSAQAADRKRDAIKLLILQSDNKDAIEKVRTELKREEKGRKTS